MKYLWLALFVTVFSCNSKPKDCTDFKTGTFEYKNASFKDWIIIRNDSIQIEFNKKENIKIVGEIKWHNNCEYSLVYKEVSDITRKNKLGTKVEIKIVKKSGDIYKYEAYNGSDHTNDWIVKISNNVEL